MLPFHKKSCIKLRRDNERRHSTIEFSLYFDAYRTNTSRQRLSAFEENNTDTHEAAKEKEKN